jgi:dTDP-glucose 4,6-dehydratase
MYKILITGVKGFICSNLTCYLVKKYTSILFIGIDSNSYCSNGNNINEIKGENNFLYFDMDITDTTALDWLFGTFNFSYVFNFAAYSSVDRSFNDPREFFTNNVIGTFNILEFSRKYNVMLLIQMSTDEVYGDKYEVAYETTPLNPTNPYSGSKACGDQMIISYINGYKFPAIIIRCNNVYGIKQYPEKVIPKFITTLISGEKCLIHGNGDQTRSFISVEDFCIAFDTIVSSGKIGEVYNVGSDDEIKIIELFELIRDNFVELFGEIENRDPIFIEDRKYNDKHYTINNDKVKLLGWKRKYNLRDSIKELILYYFNNSLN